MAPNESGFCTVVFWTRFLWEARRSKPCPAVVWPCHNLARPRDTAGTSIAACTWSATASDFKVVLKSLMGVRGHQNAALTSLSVSLDNYLVPLREERKGRIRIRGGVSAISLNWLYVSVGKHKEGLEACRRHDGKICLVYFLLLLLHACTEIRKCPSIVNWVKACLSLLPPCDSAFFLMAGRTHTVYGEEYGRGVQVNLSQKELHFLLI